MMSEIFQNLCTSEQCDSLEAEEAAAAALASLGNATVGSGSASFRARSQCALHHRSAASYQIHDQIRCTY